MRKFLYVYIFFLGITLCIVTREWYLLPTNQLTWHVPYIGQGDSMMLYTPGGNQIIIDGGPNTDILTYIGTVMPWFDRAIELLIITHPDADHITGVPELLKRYTVKTIMFTGVEHTSGRYAEVIDSIHQLNIPIIIPVASQVFHIEQDIHIEVLWPTKTVFGTSTTATNNSSIVFLLRYGKHSILFTGDIEKEVEVALLQQGYNLQIEYVKVPHHGSKTSSTQEFLDATTPCMAIISSGIDNKFHHPHAEVIHRYQTKNIPIWNTAEDGNFVLHIDKDSPVRCTNII